MIQTKLTSLNGIQNLRKIGYGLVCLQNNELNTIEQLNNVEKLIAVQMAYNSKLHNCSIKAICELNKSAPEFIYWEGNGDQCTLSSCE